MADFQIVADYDDTAAIRALADHSDVLTYEFENVDADALDAVRDRVAIPQGTDLLRVTQNRIAEKTFINDHGIGTAPWRAVQSRDELDAALAEIGYPAVLKTSVRHEQLNRERAGELEPARQFDGERACGFLKRRADLGRCERHVQDVPC